MKGVVKKAIWLQLLLTKNQLINSKTTEIISTAAQHKRTFIEGST